MLRRGITHILGCSSTGGGFFIITTSDRNLEIVEAIAALEASTPGVKLMIGDSSFSAVVPEMTLTHNDMDGGWDVQLEAYQFSELFNALAEADLSMPIRFVVEGVEFDLNPSREAGEGLKALAMLCDPRG